MVVPEWPHKGRDCGLARGEERRGGLWARRGIALLPLMMLLAVASVKTTTTTARRSLVRAGSPVGVREGLIILATTEVWLGARAGAPVEAWVEV